ncbi:26S protease regulatory subunit 7 [Capsicum chinense]|nr:26S protease regulatory subunit 7 [Capsicum chinense]
MKMIQFQDKKNHIVEVLAANDLKCNDLRSICHDDTMVLINYIEEVVIFVISYRSINNKDPKYRNGKLFISSISLSHGLSVFQDGKSGFRDSLKMMANTESKDVLYYGPPGTGKTLLARAVANRTDACFIHVIGSEFVQKYISAGARMVCELFKMANTKNGCIVFFDEVDLIRGARFDDRVGEDNEVQRTMLEIVNRLDGFDA